ncbi:MAG: hypothetical protein MZU91_13090 [Desulfosudis oleivorans]|nr:hypothetical protein [Desulfosudis oleivorans]
MVAWRGDLRHTELYRTGLADAGFKVYLVDRGLSIGGVMTMLDKTFPTNDCSMCILTSS